MSPKLLLIDGHSLAYRGFHATAHGENIMATSKGEWTNAVYVFVSKLLKAWQEEQPDYTAVVFDVGKSFRNERYAEYKANRARMPDELRYQLARIDQIVSALNIPSIGCEGYEADDLLGTLSRQATEQGLDTLIMTGDTDLLQLVDEHVRVLIPRGRYGSDTLYGPEELSQRYDGLAPTQLIDLKALTGDTSDNIPGLRGIGDKTATALLKEYGSVEGVYDHEQEIQGKRVRESLAGNKDQALLFKDLVTIRRDAPVELDLEQARTANFDHAKVVTLFGDLEFHSLMDRIPSVRATGAEGAPARDKASTPSQSQYTVVDTLPKLEEMVAALLSAPAFAFDTETTSTDALRAELVGISVAVAPGTAWYVPVGHGRRAARDEPTVYDDLPLFAAQPSAEDAAHDVAVVPIQGEAQLPLPVVVEHLKPIFENPTLLKYAHNASYDIEVLAQAIGIQTTGLACDTMVAAWVIEPVGRALGLKALAFNRLGIEMTPISDLIGSGKAQITMDQVPIAQAAPYACADADVTLQLVESLLQDLRDRQQMDLFTQIEMPLVPILVRMEMSGVKLDVGYLKQMAQELRQKQGEIEMQIYELAGGRFNLNSTRQLSEVLFERLHQPKQGIRKTSQGYSTAADVLAVLGKLENPHPVVARIQEYRQISKLQSTYVEALPALVNPRTGRVHTSYNQTGTVTGRLSSSNPNLQNIPIRTELGKQIRRGFVADEGWMLVAADYSQVELRILAHVSQDPELLDAFHKGQDVHARTAAAVYGVPIEEVTSLQRRIAKTVNFGLIYGQSAYGLSQQTELDFDEAERFIATYFARYPGVKTWLEGTRQLAYAQGYVETLLGRRRYFPELQSTQRALSGERAAAERQAINAPVQGTAADILKIAMVRLDQRLRDKGLAGKMVLQVHDELVLEVPQEELHEVVSLTCEVMESAYRLSVPLKVDIEVGENWLDMEPAKPA